MLSLCSHVFLTHIGGGKLTQAVAFRARRVPTLGTRYNFVLPLPTTKMHEFFSTRPPIKVVLTRVAYAPRSKSGTLRNVSIESSSAPIAAHAASLAVSFGCSHLQSVAFGTTSAVGLLARR